ncbi:hypothetical protein PATSB16_06710 [Pandoraea thiooxydans]|nr:hypothetical protein PATSB16_06710 [Pandoraea thiooxydans]
MSSPLTHINPAGRIAVIINKNRCESPAFAYRFGRGADALWRSSSPAASRRPM